MKKVKNPITGIFEDVNNIDLTKEQKQVTNGPEEYICPEIEPIIEYEEEDETP